MSIKEQTCFTITCDICDFSSEDACGAEHFDSAEKAQQAAKEDDWYVTDDTAICWECLANDHAPVGDGERCERCNALPSDVLVHPVVAR